MSFVFTDSYPISYAYNSHKTKTRSYHRQTFKFKQLPEINKQTLKKTSYKLLQTFFKASNVKPETTKNKIAKMIRIHFYELLEVLILNESSTLTKTCQNIQLLVSFRMRVLLSWDISYHNGHSLCMQIWYCHLRAFGLEMTHGYVGDGGMWLLDLLFLLVLRYNDIMLVSWFLFLCFLATLPCPHFPTIQAPVTSLLSNLPTGARLQDHVGNTLLEEGCRHGPVILAPGDEYQKHVLLLKMCERWWFTPKASGLGPLTQVRFSAVIIDISLPVYPSGALCRVHCDFTKSPN